LGTGRFTYCQPSSRLESQLGVKVDPIVKTIFGPQ
jgi:hypothetical protein